MIYYGVPCYIDESCSVPLRFPDHRADFIIQKADSEKDPASFPVK